MGMLENSPVLPPLLCKKLLASLFICLDKSLVKISEKSRLLQLIRFILTSCFIFFLRFLRSLAVPYSVYHSRRDDRQYCYGESYSTRHGSDSFVPAVQKGTGGSGSGSGSGGVYDSGIARALAQLLATVNDLPVSSRKYGLVRSLAEKIMEENRREGVEGLLEVNRGVLSAAFTKTLGQLEAAVSEKGMERARRGDGDEAGLGSPLPAECKRLSRFLKAVGEVGWWRREVNQSAEKLAAELLWLADKMAGYECVEEAVCKWAAARRLGRLALTIEPRVQDSLVKLSGTRVVHPGLHHV